MQEFLWVDESRHLSKSTTLLVSLVVAIELIVQHIRDFLNNRGRNIQMEFTKDQTEEVLENACGSTPTTPIHGKKKIESHPHNMHRPH